MMQDRQENKLRMYLSVQNTINNFNAEWQGVPAFGVVFKSFEEVIAKIQETRLVQEGDLTGITKDKALAKENAIGKALEISTGVFVYGSVSNNNALMAKVDYSPSELRRSRDTVIADRLQIIHDEANSVLSNLADYGIDQADIRELQTLIDAYAETIEDPRTSIATRSQATTALVELFKEGDKIVKEQLDKLMGQFKSSNAKFYQVYFNTRKIIDLGIRQKADEIEV
jgi:hypothetical protein